jgi:DNA-binding FadR family transcriptional regulator
MAPKEKKNARATRRTSANRSVSDAVTGRRLRLHGVIARDIGVAIVSGKHKPGDLLDGEVAASDHLKVSRGAYREAVRILAAKGLIESRPKVGTRVSPPERWHMLDPDVLSWIFAFEPDPTLLANVFELRQIVEPQAAAMAAERRTDEDLQALASALRGMEEHTLAAEEGRQADQAFHSALLRASRNAFVISLTTGVCSAVTWTTIFKQRHSPLRRDPMPDHVAVYEAVAARDAPAARAAMAKLIELARLDTTSLRKPRA